MMMVAEPDEHTHSFMYQVQTAKPLDANTIRCVLDLGWNISLTIDVDLYGLAFPDRRSENPLERKAARAVRTVVELWLAKTKGPMALHSIDRSQYANRCYGDLLRLVPAEESLTEGLLKQGLVKVYPNEDGWTDEELNNVLHKACKLLSVPPESVPD